MIFQKRCGWIGVDIGARAVKVVQAERRGNYIDVEHALVIQRQTPWNSDGIAEGTPLESVEEIRAAISLPPGFRGHHAACTLPMSVCDIRGYNIASGSEAERREMIRGYMQTEFGDAESDREFDFWATDVPGEPATNVDNVSVLSLTRDWAMQVANDCSQSGLAVQQLDGLPLAIARAMTMAGPQLANQPVAVIDWGFSRATFCLVANGRPLFVRSLRDSGYSLLLQAMSRQLSVSPDEATKLLGDHGVRDRRLPNQDELQRVIEEVAAEPLAAFVEEVNRTLNFLSSHRRSIAPEQVVLFGAGATIKNMTAYLAEKVEMPVTTWRPENVRVLNATIASAPLELFGPAIALSTLAWSC